MKRWILVLAVSAVAIAIAAWRLLGALDEDAPIKAPTETSIGSQNATATSSSTTRSSARRKAPVSIGAATLRGTVRDESKRAIASARVCAVQRSADLSRADVTRGGCVMTASDGTYTLANVRAPIAFVSASAAKRTPKTESMFALVDGETRTIDFVLSTNVARLVGSVRDLNGVAIGGARVTAEGTFTDTRADGTYELWVEPGPADVSVTAEGFATTGRSTFAPTTTDFTLEPGGTIAGTVVDASGAPVAGARVIAGSARTTSSETGTFELAGLTARSYEVTAQDIGASGATSPVVVGLGQHVNGVIVRMGEAFQVVVTVRRPDKTPCLEAMPSIDDDHGRVGEGRFDGHEAFVFDGIPGGVYRVAARCGSWNTRETLDVKADLEITLEKRAGTTGTLRVTVEAPGRLASDADRLLLAIRESTDVWRSVPVPANRVIVEELEAGTYSLRIASTSTLEGEEETTVIRGGETTEVVIHVAPPAKGLLRVLTVDPQGRNVGNIPVSIVGEGVRDRIWTTASGEGAMYLPPGEYEISYRDTSVQARVIHGTTREARLRLSPTVDVRGVVVEASGAPVAGATVMRVLNEERVGGATSDGNGGFLLPAFGEPPYELFAMLSDRESPLIQTDGIQPVRLEIGAGGAITGTVVTATGEPVPRFSISLFEASSYRSFGTRNFANGSFTWRNLQPSRYRVIMQSDWIGDSTHVTLAAGAKSAAVAMKLPRTYTIRGRIVDAMSGAPIHAGVVRIDQLVEYAEGLFSSRSLPVKSDASGRFAISTLVAGEYQLAIVAGTNYLSTNRKAVVDSADVDLGDVAIARARR